MGRQYATITSRCGDCRSSRRASTGLLNRAACSSLRPDVERHSGQQHDALDQHDALARRAGQGHAVVDDTNDETTGDSADDLADATLHRRPADERRRNGIELELLTRGGTGQVQATREDDSSESAEYAHVDEDPERDRACVHARELRRLKVAADCVNMPPKDR